jgi:glycosyltransferase involved in cell wall biosynthesis
MNPLVSVIIPAYNASEWIAETVQSVLAQEFTDYEIIVVDDGSTDATGAVVARFPQVRYIYQRNGGQGAARNTGIRAAQGAYIALLDADDVWKPEKLRLQVALLQQTQLAWVYCDTYFFHGRAGAISHTYGDSGRLHTGDILQPLFLDVFMSSITPVIRREVFDHVGYFNDIALVRNREDWDMFLRIAARYPVGLVNRPLAGYRIHSASSVRSEPIGRFFASQLFVVEQAAAREPARLGPLKQRAVARTCIAASFKLVKSGQHKAAARMLARAHRTAPGAIADNVALLVGANSTNTRETLIRLGKWLRFKWNSSTSRN